jgi:hypothetical protein
LASRIGTPCASTSRAGPEVAPRLPPHRSCERQARGGSDAVSYRTKSNRSSARRCLLAPAEDLLGSERSRRSRSAPTPFAPYRNAPKLMIYSSFSTCRMRITHETLGPPRLDRVASLLILASAGTIFPAIGAYVGIATIPRFYGHSAPILRAGRRPERGLRSLSRKVNQFLPAPCVLGLAAPQHWKFRSDKLCPIFISTMRLISRAES